MGNPVFIYLYLFTCITLVISRNKTCSIRSSSRSCRNRRRSGKSRGQCRGCMSGSSNASNKIWNNKEIHVELKVEHVMLYFFFLLSIKIALLQQICVIWLYDTFLASFITSKCEKISIDSMALSRTAPCLYATVTKCYEHVILQCPWYDVMPLNYSSPIC